ncbi:MAG: YhcN/YlaJ family sporulation lipoprotein [Peptococcaceae bacterium]|nr:YhcN/YlaJ family sporulation lipoprotein [Peptococcaceae bacterium]MBO5139553.1 YhcN/YlaJ family sporulation lipoprotein [Peptococcaceae bacterium]MBP3625396.1 YhcN/YlaJ family sporulation lipoprotein [Peptococcaceae bacterium]MBQ3120668.1 YhcN/YlaJ family sporulation lipoprotein [Peptococcaceae bacterium]
MFTRKKKFFVLSAALLFVSCLLLTGCSSEQNRQNTPSDNNQTPSTQNSTNMSPNNNGMNSGMNGTTNMNGTNSTDNATRMGTSTTGSNSLHQRAEKIADAVVDDIDAVKDARVIISDKMAYVSVSITETAGADTAKTLKEEVGQVVKKTDTAIEDVYVMEDADTFTRMKEMVDDIADGKPVSGFIEELDNMFTRVMPSKE